MNIRTPLACLPLIFATSCYDTQPSVSTGNGGPGAGTQGPFALGPVLYFDLSGDSRGAEGNRLELRFDRPVALGDPSELDLRLPTPGDSFGEFTALVDPDSPDTLGIWLGPDAQLRTRGLAGSGIPQTGNASSLRIPPAGTIRDAATGTFPAEEQTLDVFPGLVVWPLLAGDQLPAAAGLLTDLNGDGAKDLVTTGGTQDNGWLRWQMVDHGGQPLGDVTEITLPDQGLSLAAGRLQGGPAVDLVVGTLGSSFMVVDPQMDPPTLLTLEGCLGAQALLITDTNRNGKDDLIAGGSNGLWLTLDDSGSPPSATQLISEAPRHLALIDADRDGRKDLVVAHHDRTEILLGSCQAGYILGATLPLATTFDLQVIDVDQDGINDLVGAGPWGVQLLRGMGDGGFWPSESIRSDPTQSISCVDLDGDTRPEILALGTSDGAAEFTLLQTQNGEWSPVQTGTLPGIPLDLLAHDWDGDGDMDHVTLGTQTHLLTSSLSGTFGDWFPDSSPLDLGSGPVSAMTTADFDGDGDQDLALAELGTITLWRNDGGALVAAIELAVGLNRVEDLAFRDIDQDGDLDLFACGTVSGLVVLMNNGGAYEFAPPALIPATPPSNSMAFGDLDSDGDLDLVLGALRGHADLVLLNHTSSDNPGSGGGDTVPPCSWFGFETGQELSVKMTHKLALADLDQDGTLDLFCGHGVAESNSAWVGQGDGTFLPVFFMGSESATYDLVLGDLNQDGVIDLLPASEDADSMRAGTGDGTFVYLAQIQQSQTTALAWEDLNGDGVRDLVTTHDFGGPTRVRYGPWNYYTIGTHWTLASSMHNLVLLDLDSDGGLELIVTSELDGVAGQLYRAR